MPPAPRRIRDRPRLPLRERNAHKGSFGRVLIIGGSVGMAGAPSLAGMAALRSGAGLVTIAVPEPILPTVAAACPCATTIPLPATRAGRIDPAGATRSLRQRGLIGRGAAGGSPPDVLVVGPGVGTGGGSLYAARFWALVDAFRIRSSVPTVIDADAINLAGVLRPRGWDRRAHPRTVFTPHPGELARLLSTSTRQIQADRQAMAVATARRLNQDTDPAARAVLVLKGAGTIVTDGESVYVNRTGNPGMATGGSGDVLSGVIAGLIGQGLTCLDAAILGVYIHGLAGDRAAVRVGEVSLIATDLIDALPQVFLGDVKPRPSRRATSLAGRKKTS
ncbi:MAG: NAD(P)H-hydrate dehydratase [Planctomycetes bacterium]|nr:NAD(P)H-hydrate dehydratase [Planctomycetota bacterium]